MTVVDEENFCMMFRFAFTVGRGHVSACCLADGVSEGYSEIIL